MNKNPIEVIEETPFCAWCHHSLEGEDLADHAFSCTEGAVSAVLEELTQAFKQTYRVDSVTELPFALQTAWEIGIKQARARIRARVEERKHGPQ